MDTTQIEHILKTHFPQAEFYVQGENAHFNLIAVSDELAGLSRLKQQQTLYAPLMNYFSTGEIHALSIRTFSQEKWQKERILNGF